ncbi:MAG: carbon-nitrogen hydrolase [Gemmatimonadaceae bacterium]
MVSRIAVASIPLTATLEEAVPAAIAAVEEAGSLGARIICLPEAALPGHRLQSRHVPDFTHRELDQALDMIAAAAARARVVTIVGAERPTPGGREIIAVVLDADGARRGEQVKTQLDPSEELLYVAGSGRRTFTTIGIKFAIAICHEAFCYPEIIRGAALDGVQVVFVPHFVTTGGGPLPKWWCDASNPYNEKALMCRALENTVYVAQSNFGGVEQGCASGIVAPDGSLVAQVPYGEIGVRVADVDLSLATGLLARRWAPERNRELLPTQ